MGRPAKSTERVFEEAVSRTLRDNLANLETTNENLQQAYADLVAACSSNRPTNALPPMLRAQAAAASLEAMLGVLAKFVSSAMAKVEGTPDPEEAEQSAKVAVLHAATVVEELTAPAAESDVPETVAEEALASAEIGWEEQVAEPAPAPEPVPEVAQHPPVEQVPPPPEPVPFAEEPPAPPAAEFPPPVPEEPTVEAVVEEAVVFDLHALPAEQQELHRRANRVAKVSMQDIQMLRPRDVLLGREHRDLCVRLRADLDKARKEYDRRFQSIQDHPVDYFHYWMVEILAGGDAEVLGEYPYPTPALRH